MSHVNSKQSLPLLLLLLLLLILILLTDKAVVEAMTYADFCDVSHQLLEALVQRHHQRHH